MSIRLFSFKKTTILSLLVCTTWAALPQAWAQEVNSHTTIAPTTDTRSAKPTDGREKIGLVLSGGGARGLAHLGVLRELEKQHVPIDYIAGTSAGALIGGMYASGMSVDEIESSIKNLDLSALAFGSLDRRKLPQHTRSLEYKSNDVVDVSISESKGVSLPIAVSDGTQVEAFLRSVLKNKPYDTNFDHLPIPFRAVASDLVTGKMVELKDGQLVQAMRASMSIPGVFTPVEIDGKLLVDGMVARNLPIDVARRMGATRIIAVDVGSALRTKEQLGDLVGISDQILGLLVKRNVNEQIETLTPKDLLIKPALGDLGNLDFKAAGQAAKLGAAATDTPASRQKLAEMAVSPSVYAQRMARHINTPAPSTLIDYVRVQTNGLASPNTLQQQLQMKNGQPFDIDVVNRDIERLMASGRISQVRYEVNPVGNHHELVYLVTEKDVARNAIRAGVEVEGDSATNQQFTLHLSHRNVWVNKLGAEWRNQLSIGKSSTLATEFNQPLNERNSVYIRPWAKYTYEKRPVYLGEDRTMASEFRRSRKEVGFLVGTPIKRIGEWGIGLSRRNLSISGDDNNPLTNISNENTWRNTIDAQLTLDQLDDVSLPTKGYFLRAYANYSPQKQNGTNFWQAGVQSLLATSIRQHSFNLRLEAGATNNEKSTYSSPFSLGGYQHLSGYAKNQFIGNYMAFASATYRYKTSFSLLNNPLYVGASIEAGNTWAKREDISSSWYYSGSIFGSINTPIGPAQLGLGFAPRGHTRFYFYLGRTFTDQ